jgi:hypothetical protein
MKTKRQAISLILVGASVIGGLGFGISTFGQTHKKPAPALWGGGFNTGNDLLSRCDPASLEQRDTYIQYRAECRAYIMGVSDTSGRLNIPPNTEAAQLREIVVAYLTAHPETREKSAASLVIAALYKFYPAP